MRKFELMGYEIKFYGYNEVGLIFGIIFVYVMSVGYALYKFLFEQDMFGMFYVALAYLPIGFYVTRKEWFDMSITKKQQK